MTDSLQIKRSFRRALINGKLWNKFVECQEDYFEKKKKNLMFLCHSKYSSSLDTFQTYFVN